MKNNNKCAQQRNTHHGVEGEIIEGQQGRGDDEFKDKLSCVVAVITIWILPDQDNGSEIRIW